MGGGVGAVRAAGGPGGGRPRERRVQEASHRGESGVFLMWGVCACVGCLQEHMSGQTFPRWLRYSAEEPSRTDVLRSCPRA